MAATSVHRFLYDRQVRGRFTAIQEVDLTVRLRMRFFFLQFDFRKLFKGRELGDALNLFKVSMKKIP